MVMAVGVLEADAYLIADKIKAASHIVVFTGAGISTASGLPDYRGANGIWTRRSKGLPISRTKQPWFQFEPNEAHFSLARMIHDGIIDFLISQNVDGLHLKSGVPESKIAELHGNSTILQCIYCHSRYHLDDVGWNRAIHGLARRADDPPAFVPVCLCCGGRLVSTVVDFGDKLPRQALERARTESIQADLFLVLGSSLMVSPAASLPKIAKYHGAELVIVNIGPTKRDKLADRKFEYDLSILMPKISNILEMKVHD